MTLWTAGFDIIYSCQDVEFDRSAGLRSLPVRLGVARALQVSRLFHAGMVALLAIAWRVRASDPSPWPGSRRLQPCWSTNSRSCGADDMSRVDAAFFAVNGWVSMLFFATWAADLWLMA